jgi:hypothetical protein
VTSPDDLILLEGGGRNVVHRRGDVVIRAAGPWTPAVHALLRHLEDVGFTGAPRLVGSGLAPDGRETLTFIEGKFTQPDDVDLHARTNREPTPGRSALTIRPPPVHTFNAPPRTLSMTQTVRSAASR